jgi:hypothetical protein
MSKLFKDTLIECILEKEKPQLHFITFYTEGPGFDNCFDLRIQEEHMRMLVEPFVDRYKSYSKRELKTLPNSEDICNEYSEPLKENKHVEKIGYFEFKFFLILYELENNLAENDILIYHDSNIEKFPQYKDTDFTKLKEYCMALLKVSNTDVFIPLEGPVYFQIGSERHMRWDTVKIKHTVKTYSIKKVLGYDTVPDIIYEHPMLNAPRIIMRNTKFTRDFFKEASELMKQRDLYLSEPDNDRHPHWKWCTGDQDVLNLLMLKYKREGKLPLMWPNLWFENRILSEDTVHEYKW